MKTIGFADYYISEWHANNYPAWISEMNEKLGTDYRIAYGWAEENLSPTTGETTAQWCERFGVEQCKTIEELCEKSDVIMVLAPGNPETHLAYAEKVLPFQKRTYIDKTFAPDAATAQKIFDLGAKYGTPFFSSSALRYATELDGIEKPQFAATTGGGRSLEEYIIHQVEMLVKVMDGRATAVKVDEQGDERLCTIRYTDGRTAQMLYGPTQSFSVKAETADGKTVETPISSDFFKLLIGDILCFFTDGKLPFDPAQTMEVMRIREAAVKGLAKPGQWMEL